jgi:hypothetical protein
MKKTQRFCKPHSLANYQQLCELHRKQMTIVFDRCFSSSRDYNYLILFVGTYSAYNEKEFE